MTCPACGKQPAHSVEDYHYLESGLQNVFVRGVGIYRCKCGQEYVQLPGAQKVHAEVALALLNKTSLLTGPEAKFLRKWLRLTSEEMAQALGYTRVTVSRWENEGLSAKTDRALRLYASSVRNILIDFGNLFPTITDRPQKKFRIVVGGVHPVRQYSVDTSALSATTMISVQEALADFAGVTTASVEPTQGANQELALAA